MLRKPAPRDSVDRIAPTPIFFIHGTDDPIVDERHSEILYARAHEPKRLEIIAGGGHAQEIFRQEPERFLALVEGWFATTLTAPVQLANTNGHQREAVTAAMAGGRN